MEIKSTFPCFTVRVTSLRDVENTFKITNERCWPVDGVRADGRTIEMRRTSGASRSCLAFRYCESNLRNVRTVVLCVVYFTHWLYASLYLFIHLCADPVASRCKPRALSARTLGRGFESRLRHGCLSLVYVVLSCAGRGLATTGNPTVPCKI
jgi:hypothetical protein